MSGTAKPNWPGNDAAVLCAAVEREVERWATVRREQGSKPPRCTRSSCLRYLFGDSAQRAARACKQAEVAGLLARREFERYGPGWRLTRKGNALAQEGEVLCYDCGDAPSLADTAAKGCCAACAAKRAADRADDEERSAKYYREEADEHDAAAAKHRARAESYRALEVGTTP